MVERHPDRAANESGQLPGTVARADADANVEAEAARLLGLGPKLKDLLEDLDLGRAPTPGDVPTHFGRYRVIRLIGEGGMGSVYEAEQANPRRLVALKVIKPGMDTKQVIARFEAEREALGRMDHPNIARVYDAGATDAGRPFFAMELVDGVPITAYSDAHKLTVRRRLELFIAVCRAVQHAHQKGIIHRDLKPSNVLVTLVDGEPVPKVIDFGIAKAIAGQRLSDQTVVTEVQQLVGTPEYMSPEQAGAGDGDVDTRSDVYSLGVLLYELLTGTTPFAHKQLRSLGYEEVRRIIREDEPPRPSTRVGVTGEALAAAGARRQGGAEKLAGALRRELDWIVMRCLEKDRTRRYDTPMELAQDVERHLADEPVSACPPSAAYRLRKFARRNKATVAAGVLVLLLLGTFGGATGWVLWETTRLRLQLADAHVRRGRREADLREAVRLNPNLAGARVSLAWVLEDKGDLRAAEAEIREAIRVQPAEGNSYHSLGDFLERNNRAAEAVAVLEQGARLDPGDPDVHQRLGHVYASTGRWPQAAAAFTRALELRPANIDARISRASVLLQTGDVQGYRRDCAALVERFQHDPEYPVFGADMARLCFLAPGGGAELERALDIADKSVTGTGVDASRWYCELIKGWAEYRRGRPTEALHWLKGVWPRLHESSFPCNDEAATAMIFAIAAMAHHELGEDRRAESALDTARGIVASKMPVVRKYRAYNTWDDWLHAQMLCQEADALINGSGPQP